MIKRIRLTFPAIGTKAIVDLLWKKAPRTCEAVWNALPMQYPAIHGRRCGKELFILTDPLPMRVPENATTICRPGDVFLIYLPPTWSDDHEGFNRTPEGLFDIAFIYGEDALLRGRGLNEILAGNLFGRIVEGLSEFGKACDHIWVHGGIDLRLEPSE